MTRQARLPVMITKFGNLVITARLCLLPYHHDPGVGANPCLLTAPSTDYAKAVDAAGPISQIGPPGYVDRSD
jgi:hypothetical protein